MKKCKASSGQNGQLVHWWLLVHSGRESTTRKICYSGTGPDTTCSHLKVEVDPQLGHNGHPEAGALGVAASIQLKDRWFLTYITIVEVHPQLSHKEQNRGFFLVYFKVGYMMQYCMLLYKIKEGPGHVPLPNAQYIRD